MVKYLSSIGRASVAIMQRRIEFNSKFMYQLHKIIRILVRHRPFMIESKLCIVYI